MAQPNILWLVGDHWAFKHHIDLYDQLKLETYEELGLEGVVFDQAYSVCPLCQPARSSMLTGTYPHRHGILLNDEESGGRFRFAPDQKMVTHYLQGAGYRNVYFGKWHCGREKIARDWGFEGWSLPGYGAPYKSKKYADYLDEQGLPRPEVLIEWDVRNPENVGKTFRLGEVEVAGFGPWVAAGKLDAPLETHEAEFTAHLACRWLEENARGSQPFFMRVDVWGPHSPYHSAGEFIDRLNPASLDPYPGFGQHFDGMPGNFAFSTQRWDKGERTRNWTWWQTGLARCFEQVMIVDHALGRVVDTLDSLGLADNTLVVYTADHGDLIAAHGGKMNKDTLMLEETERVPMVLRWPARFAGGKVSRALVSNMDPAATALDAAGCPSLPEDLDCESMLGLCCDPEAPGRDALMCEDHGESAVEYFQRMIRWKHYKYVAHLDDLDELYDLAEDPFELSNLVHEPGYAPVLRQGRDVAKELMEKHEDCSADAERLKRQLRNH